jgi:hypothetical protein
VRRAGCGGGCVEKACISLLRAQVNFSLLNDSERAAVNNLVGVRLRRRRRRVVALRPIVLTTRARTRGSYVQLLVHYNLSFERAGDSTTPHFVRDYKLSPYAPPLCACCCVRACVGVSVVLRSEIDELAAYTGQPSTCATRQLPGAVLQMIMQEVETPSHEFCAV